MNMPKFTGEASLYRTNGHYRTSRHALHGAARMTGTILPAMEEIEIEDCLPGTYKVELPDGSYECRANPAPGWPGGGGIPGIPGVPSQSGSGSGGEPGKEEKGWAEKTGREWHRKCQNPDGHKWLRCCEEKSKQCWKVANKNPKLQLDCADATAWCKGDNPRT